MLILNPNPCIDLTFWVNTLVVGSVHRATKNETTAGGKGINVARACQTMGMHPALYLTLPKLEGGFYKELLAAEGHDVEYFDVDGEVRKAVIVNKAESSAVTVINGAGPAISKEDWQEFCNEAAKRVAPGELVLSMGSLPTNFPDDALALLNKAIHSVGGKLLIDTAPIAFPSLQNEVVDFISPNVEEAEALLNKTSGDLFIPNDENVEARAMAAAEALYGNLAKNVLVTAGSHGCAFKNDSEHWWLPAYVIPADRYKSAVGAGDSFVAGFAMYVEKHSSAINWQTAVRYGMATAAASCETYRAGGFEKSRVLEILGSDADE
jgi:1-phosphofructokinase family hexose kinase